MHTAVAMVGAGAASVGFVECMNHGRRWKRFILSSVALASLIVLALMPCFPAPNAAAVHKQETPALETRPDIDHVEKLLIAHYRRIRTEREIDHAWPE